MSSTPSATLTNAVEAFRTLERKRLAADKAETDLLVATAALSVEGTDEDRAEYFRLTQEILAEYEEKRAKAKIG